MDRLPTVAVIAVVFVVAAPFVLSFHPDSDANLLARASSFTVEASVTDNGAVPIPAAAARGIAITSSDPSVPASAAASASASASEAAAAAASSVIEPLPYAHQWRTDWRRWTSCGDSRFGWHWRKMNRCRRSCSG
jgi:hypothetical protein